jgi:CDP-diacylglycerol--glycerol-3-phosphate 3-phosphatidyltransferase
MCWIPNLLTLSRPVFLLPLMWLLAAGTGPGAHWLAFALFLVAAMTDALDGWAARRLGCASNVGVFLDPLADKVFANVLLIFLACRLPEWVPLWVVLLLVAREFVVQGFRSMAPCVGVVIRTGTLNKLKLVFQLAAIGTALAGQAWADMAAILRWATWLGLGLAAASAYVSMYTLLRDNADLWSRPQIPMEIR